VLRNTITTVIPTYRRPKLLERAIWSALSQKYPKVRVLVCDNASRDSTEQLVKDIASQDQRVQYHCQKENIGSYPNFNFGISQVRTEYFSLLSDDDILTPDFYSGAMRAFNQFTDVSVVRMPTLVIDVDGNVISGPREVPALRRYAAGEVFEPHIATPMPEAWTGLVFRTGIIKEIGSIDEQAGPFADGGFVMRAVARYPYAEVPGVGGILMAHQNSTSGNLDIIGPEWRTWWERMIGAIESDVSLRALVRRNVRKLAYPNLDRIALVQFYSALAASNIVKAQAVAAGLRRCDHLLYPLLMRILCRLIEYFPGAMRIIRKFHQDRKKKNQVNIQQLNSRYGYCLEFLRKFKSTY